MIDDHFQFCRISYWLKNGEGHLVSASKENWDECVVAPVSSYSSYGEQRFYATEPHVNYKIEALISLLQQAYGCGKAAKLREIQKILEIPLK